MELLTRGLSLHRKGDFDGAIKKYRAVLAVDPLNPDALHLMGVVFRQRGDNDAAIDFLIKACAARPSNKQFLIDCGDSLVEKKSHGAALVYYEKALSIDPLDAQTLFKTAAARRGEGNLDAALADLQKALLIRPDYFEALCNCAEILRSKRDHAQALSCMERALALKPQFALGHNAAGQLCEKLGNSEKALYHYREAVGLDESCAEAHNNLGNALCGRGDYNAAIASYQRALTLRTDFFEAYYNLGNCLRETNHFDEAIGCFQAALKLRPDSVPALSNYAEALQVIGRIDEAQKLYSTIQTRLGKRYPQAYDNLLLCMNYDFAHTPRRIFEEHARFGTIFGAAKKAPRHANVKDPLRTLRIGYVSPDFCDHPVSRFIEPLLTRHDRERHEIFCYACAARPDGVSRRMQALTLTWRDIHGIADEQAVGMIGDDRIDILVDLAGHTAGNRLSVFAQRPSPISVSYCGYPNTTGLTEVDYYVTDACLDPDEDASLYTERLVRLPNCFCCYMPPPNAPDVNDVPALQNGHITFGSLHPLTRLNGQVIDLWSEVLRAVPTAHLRIVRDTLIGSAMQRLLARFSEQGINPQRIDLRHEVPAHGHLTLFHDIDISLDTFPWSGHTTACESLWMGVPVVTLYGDRHAGRMAATIARTAGLPDWVASTREEYCAIAQAAARSLDELKSLRGRLRGMMASSDVCNAEKFTRRMEAAYRSMWMRWCEE